MISARGEIIPVSDDNRLLGFLVETQKDQTKTLGLLSTIMARVETKIENWHERDREQDVRTDDIDRRVTLLEHEQTKTRTGVRIIWGALAFASTVVTSVVSWLLSR